MGGRTGKKSSAKKPYIDKINGKHLVWEWSKQYGRYINTHMYDNQRDAELVISKKKAPE